MFGWQGYFHWFSSLMKHYFQFTEVQITMFYTALGVLYVFLQCAVVNLFVRYNIHRRVIFYTLPLIAVSFFMMGWAHSFIVLIVFSVVYMICISFYLPFWKSYISLKHITSHQMLFIVHFTRDVSWWNYEFLVTVFII